MKSRLQELWQEIQTLPTKAKEAATESLENFNSEECAKERNKMFLKCRNNYDTFGILGSGKCKVLEKEYYQCRDASRLRKGK